MNLDKNAIYFKSLTIVNLNCFKGKHEFNFSDSKGNPFQWNVILGNNNTGKTTILRALADFRYRNLDKNKYVPIGIFNPGNIDENYKVSSIIYPNIEYFYSKNKTNKNNLPIQIEGYGVKRKSSKKNLVDLSNKDTTHSLYDDSIELTNTEEWLLQLDYSIKNGSVTAKKRLVKVKEVLVSEIIPDVKDFEFVTDEKLDNYVLFHTDFGKVKYNALGYGYQTTISWLVDLMKKMFERYPDSKNPLYEPAIVLVDEIDLHLHPEWQRKIIQFVGRLFPNTQFIATTHSPLVIQSAEDINVIVLQKDGDNISVKQPDISTFKGWTVEEILTELMELGEKTKSDQYLKLINQFDKALDENNKEQAESVYNELDKILHPASSQRKILKIQMTALTSE